MPELAGLAHRAACFLADGLPPATPFHENTTGGERLTRLAARFQRENG